MLRAVLAQQRSNINGVGHVRHVDADEFFYFSSAEAVSSVTQNPAQNTRDTNRISAFTESTV